ncbi:DUF1657 domain-containing protein [Lentibacillus saliphilus]|uniref:DUF1657 domain-containing protein n=1 Tax=Lentibacillus saliphilus TaxID=2737028 RepID=UPI001C3003FF|nr:DUF1657 domain-containing protein [Lentibacillus saliphilus]
MTVGSQVKSCLSSIKSAEASTRALAQKTRDKDAKDAYEQAATILSHVKDDIQKQVMMISNEEPQYKS